jgi:hypothetical protein
LRGIWHTPPRRLIVSTAVIASGGREQVFGYAYPGEGR